MITSNMVMFKKFLEGDSDMDLTPRGCSSIGGELARGMERARSVMLDFFASYGYDPFNPAELQLLDGTMKNLPRRRRERIIAVNSPFGEPCCMRADITVSALSYMSTHYAPEDFPIRLCYAERIFSAPVPPKQNIEDTQIGVELLGWESAGADVEVTAMLMRALGRLGLDRSVMVLGDASILPSLLDGFDEPAAARITELLQNCSYAAYADAVREADCADESAREILLALPRLKGGAELLGDARALFGSRASVLDGLCDLATAVSLLVGGERVRVDLGFVRDLNYYRGPIFNVYSSEVGVLLGGGGRYDGTLSGTRFECQAIGFGLSLRELALAVGYRSHREPAAIWAGGVDRVSAMALADRLSEAGTPFVMSWEPDRDRSRERARKRGCFAWVDMLGDYAEDLATGERTSSVDAFERSVRI